MKVVIYEETNPYNYRGGAEISGRKVLEGGRRRGHEVSWSDPTKGFMEGYDVHIVGSMRARDFLTKFSDKRHECMVKYEHDYRFCLHQHIQCYSCRDCHPDVFVAYRKFFRRTKLNIFQSPLHRDVHLWACGVPKKTSFCLLTQVDIEKFKPFRNIERKRDHCMVVAGYCFHKGTMDYVLDHMRRHPRRKFTIFGDRWLPKYLPQNAKLMGYVPNDFMPQHYSAHRFLVHLPRFFDPSCRAIVEGVLCGCKPITNANVGNMSWKFPMNRNELVKRIPDSLNELWDRIEDVAKG